MDESSLATKIASQVVSDTKFWIAIIGIVGGIVGSLLTLLGNIFLHKLKEKPQKELDEKRKITLKMMLEDDRFPEKWRNINTLSAVIGASKEETKRLLVGIDARGSEKADGKWGLIKYHPFPTQK
ncbi:hypothetical protein MMIC_P0403 [Mariprofundus micogutta]|uniref:Uncharacterized protein n=1 Tax=Mariprofundus micogutta TaxID=1921010 RepID=A0A1L8CKS5_9PROT|nr:hypothetical protein [Mariprofundus micogutta]GAV19469.1 hypothetical protein MMIC_P0403 [Mariprofundus micogutta]